jgi:hypothetical protein
MMPRSDSTILRMCWALFGLVLLGVTVAGPLADALLEDSSERVVHIESESSEDCGSHHDHWFCQVCRFVAEGPHESSTACVPAPLSAPAGVVLVDAGVSPVGTSLVSAHGSRAPPRA